MQPFQCPQVSAADVPVFVPGYGMCGNASYIQFGFICWLPAPDGLFDTSTHFIVYSKEDKLSPKATVSPRVLNPPAIGFTLKIRQLNSYKYLTSAMVDGCE